MFGQILDKLLLRESASVEDVTKAMDNHSMVIINYHSDGKDSNTGSRVIEPFCYGLTKAGNPVIRAYQPYGDTTTVAPGWKLFRLDRISYWEETGRKFTETPSDAYGKLNIDGDDTMKTVIKDYRSTLTNDATAGSQTGPKTKEKVFANTTGDRSANLGARNVKNQQNAIKIDIDNNKKASNSFNMSTNDTQISTGPRTSDQSYKPNIHGSVENGDIDKNELEQARQEVYSDRPVNDFSQYSHTFSDEEWEQAEKDQQEFNRKDKRNNYDRDRRWAKSSDSRYLTNKDSNNRLLNDMEDIDDDFDF